MSAPKKILIEGQTEHGGEWMVEADMEGDDLGLIHLFIETETRQGQESGAAIACNVADLDQLIDALNHAATSIAWIEKHGLEPTYEGAAEPPS